MWNNVIPEEDQFSCLSLKSRNIQGNPHRGINYYQTGTKIKIKNSDFALNAMLNQKKKIYIYIQVRFSVHWNTWQMWCMHYYLTPPQARDNKAAAGICQASCDTCWCCIHLSGAKQVRIHGPGYQTNTKSVERFKRISLILSFYFDLF